MNAIMVDLEGTLSNCNHRLHHLERKDYHQWNIGLVDDPANKMLIEFVERLSHLGIGIFITTAKPSEYREITKRWLHRHVNFPYSLMMRAKGDNRSSALVKKSMICFIKAAGWDIILGIDDRDDICRLFKSKNICYFQVRTK